MHRFSLLLLLCLATTHFTQAQPYPPPVMRPLGDIIKDLSDGSSCYGFQAARDYASEVINGDGSSQGHHSKAKDEFIGFEGAYTFPALADADRGKFGYSLVMFSDDGCDLTIPELPAPAVLLDYGVAQALPDTDNSFKIIPQLFDSGQQVNMKVMYSNVKYTETGYVDIDGCTLFVVKRPMVDIAISLFGEELALPEDRIAGTATHEMAPGGVVLAPVNDAGGAVVSAGKRTKITLRAGYKPADGGSFTLSASPELSKINIYNSKDSTDPLPLPKTWNTVEDFAADAHTYYIGSGAFSQEEVPQSGTLTFTYQSPNGMSFENPSLTDQVKVTIQPGNQVIIRPARAVNKNKLVIPMAEIATAFPKIGQEVEIEALVPDDFNGQVEVTNKNPEEIGLWKSPSGSNDELDDAFTIQIQAGKIVADMNAPRSFFVKGKIETTTAEIEAKLVKSGDSNPPQTDQLDVAVVEVGMREVVFDASGAGCIPLTRDDTTPFPAAGKPHWLDMNKDGEIDGTLGETNDSIAYVKNSSPQIGCTVKINSADTHLVKIRAKCPDSMKIGEHLAPQKEGDASLAVLYPKSTVGSLPNTIKFYGKSDPTGRPSYKIDWEIQCNGGDWLPFAATKHQVYVTLTKPNGKVKTNQESLFYYACNQPNGKVGGTPAADQAIVDDVWQGFSDFGPPTSPSVTPSMHKVDPITGEPTVTPVLVFHPEGLKPLKDGTGQCGEWALFFQQVLGLHSIQVKTCNLRAKVFAKPGHIVSKTKGHKWYIKETTLKADETTFEKSPKSNVGQGNVHTYLSWPSHTICEYGGNYYDPSYGVKGSGQINFEDNAISGYGYTYEFDHWLNGVTQEDVALERVAGSSSRLDYNILPY